MPDRLEEMIERLYDAFNRRDGAQIAALCDEGMEFFPVGTAEALGREAPYAGRDGLREYMADTARVWEELMITAGEVEPRGGRLLVRGRVYARNRDLGIRDIPVAWVWEVEEGRFVRGEVFRDELEAERRFEAVSAA